MRHTMHAENTTTLTLPLTWVSLRGLLQTLLSTRAIWISSQLPDSLSLGLYSLPCMLVCMLHVSVCVYTVAKAKVHVAVAVSFLYLLLDDMKPCLSCDWHSLSSPPLFFVSVTGEHPTHAADGRGGKAPRHAVMVTGAFPWHHSCH